MSLTNTIKSKIKNNKSIYVLYNFLRNGFWKKGMDIEIGCYTRIEGIKVNSRGGGIDNQIRIGSNAHICDCQISIINGNNNCIYIGDRCSLRGTEFYVEGDNNIITLGEHTTTTNDVGISALEGTTVSIGQDCMLSTNIYISTGDGHTVCDAEGKKRTNISQDIKIDDHVWVGTRVIIGKGCNIGRNSIVAAGSVCTRSSIGEKREKVIIGGNPATVAKGDINWLRERI